MTELAIPTHTSERARNWLRYLYRKATPPDNRNKGGELLEWWDNKTTPPMLTSCRFGLLDSSYAPALMAERTPAYRHQRAYLRDSLTKSTTEPTAQLPPQRRT